MFTTAYAPNAATIVVKSPSKKTPLSKSGVEVTVTFDNPVTALFERAAS